jgi:hypothetical protein
LEKWADSDFLSFDEDTKSLLRIVASPVEYVACRYYQRFFALLDNSYVWLQVKQQIELTTQREIAVPGDKAHDG